MIWSEGSDFFYKKLKISDHFTYYYNRKDNDNNVTWHPTLGLYKDIKMDNHLNPFPGCQIRGRIFLLNVNKIIQI